MSERTIAEIVGWEYLPQSRPTGPSRWRKPNGDAVDLDEQPDPDDMLAWLKSQGYTLVSAFWDDCDIDDVKVDPYYCVDFAPPIITDDGGMPTGPTLKAAFEVAVRVVDKHNATHRPDLYDRIDLSWPPEPEPIPEPPPAEDPIVVGWARHVGAGELEFRQAGHPANDKVLPEQGWQPLVVASCGTTGRSASPRSSGRSPRSTSRTSE